MNDSKTTLKKLLYEHNAEANALLRAGYDELETAINRYLSFIGGRPSISDFIDDVVANHVPEGFSASEEVAIVSRDCNAIFGPFPPDYEGESAVAYLILRAMVDEHACTKGLILYGYARGSKKYDDMAKNFLEDVARRLISGVGRTLTLRGIEMGLDGNVSQTNYFGNQGGAVAAISNDNSTVTVNQMNGATAKELETILGNLRESACELEADRRQIALDAVDAMREILAEEKPKPTIAKTVMGALKGFNDVASFAINVAALVAFIGVNFPGLLG